MAGALGGWGPSRRGSTRQSTKRPSVGTTFCGTPLLDFYKLLEFRYLPVNRGTKTSDLNLPRDTTREPVLDDPDSVTGYDGNDGSGRRQAVDAPGELVASDTIFSGVMSVNTLA